jgi:hypothetical protein
LGQSPDLQWTAGEKDSLGQEVPSTPFPASFRKAPRKGNVCDLGNDAATLARRWGTSVHTAAKTLKIFYDKRMGTYLAGSAPGRDNYVFHI